MKSLDRVLRTALYYGIDIERASLVNARGEFPIREFQRKREGDG